MRTTVDLDSSLLKRVRVEARRRGVTVKELLATLLRRGLDERPEKTVRYKCPTFSMGDPRLPLDKALRLSSELEDDQAARELTMRK